MHLINPLEEKNWNNLILGFPEHSFFLSSNWAKVLSRTYNYSPVYLVAYSSENRLDTVVPLIEVNSILTGKRGVSLPFTDFCEPIIGSNFDKTFQELVEYAASKKWKSIEFRGGKKYFQDTDPSSFYYHHSLDLTIGEDDIFSKFCPSNKRNIRKAIKEGVKVEFTITPEAIDNFYYLNCITRKRHGLPPQPYKFFEEIYNNILSKELGIVSLASYNDKIIAGAIFFHFGYRALYKFGASDKKYQNLRPNNLIMWDAIKFYILKELKELSFGKTEPENHGLRRFKLAWGSEEEKIFTYKYDVLKDKFVPNPDSAIGFHNVIFRMMPLPLLKLIGNTLYRHLG